MQEVSVVVCRSLKNTFRVTPRTPYTHLAVFSNPSESPSLLIIEFRPTVGASAHTPISCYRKHAPLGVAASSLALSNISTLSA